LDIIDISVRYKKGFDEKAVDKQEANVKKYILARQERVAINNVKISDAEKKKTESEIKFNDIIFLMI
jgi:hypothetical protein